MATILVADDNSNIQKMVGLALKDHGIDVVAVGNGEAAVRRIPDVHPDLILADIFMPVKNGYEVCEFVKKDPQYAHIPVILLVGAFDPLDEREAQRVGADGVLKKPFIPPDPLISMVKSALARAGESRRAVPIPLPQPVLAAVAHSEPVVEQPLPVSTKPAIVSFGDTNRPVAFGSLLETESSEVEAEAEAYVAPVRHPELSDSRNWGAISVEEEVEEEEEQPTSWRANSVSDELVAADDENTAERSPYADTALIEKEDLVTSTGTFAAEHSETEAALAPAEASAHNFFAEPGQTPHDATEVPQDDSVTKVHADSQDNAEVPAPEPQQPNPESERKPDQESDQRKAFETVFTPDAFPGLFVEERPLSPIELAGESLQDSPSAFAELSAGVTESVPSSGETHSLETPLPAKLPSLWEEQVRQAARLIASSWPTGNQAAESPEHATRSLHSESLASESFSQEHAHPELESSQEHDSTPQKAQEPQSSETSSQALESTPEYSSWLTKQGQQLLTSGEKQAREAETAAQDAFGHEDHEVSTHLDEPAAETVHSHGSPAQPSIDVNESLSSERQSEMAAIDESIAAAYSFPETQIDPTRDSESAAEYQRVADVHASASPATAPPPTAVDQVHPATASASAPDLDAVVAKVLARMNPEMFQSMTQQLLKPVIEAIVRSELEKKQ